MGKPMIILADTDYDYLSALETRFVQLFENNAEYVVITDSRYFKEYFSVQRRADLLVIGERLYSEDFKKHDIQKIVVLSENSGNRSEKENCLWLDRYSNIKSIVNEASFGLKDRVRKSSGSGTKVVVVCSPAGGSGKTTVALGICKCLVNQHKKVLYINTEIAQGFQYYLENKKCLAMEGCHLLREESQELYAEMKTYIRSEGFDFIPPLPASLDSLEISFDVFRKLAFGAKKAQEYDYIVIDTDNILRPETEKFLMLADTVEIVARQDGISAEKMSFMLQNIDCGNPEKYIFICNHFDRRKENRLKPVLKKQCHISGYIEEYPEPFVLEDFAENETIKNLVYMLL